jgi:hypothetical protein
MPGYTAAAVGNRRNSVTNMAAAAAAAVTCFDPGSVSANTKQL